MGALTETVPGGPSAAVRKIGVVGGGIMGNGIAQVFATSGFEVELVDVSTEFVDRALGMIGKSLDRVAKKQNWPAGQAPGILKRIHGGTSLQTAGECDLIVEAVGEDFALKRRIFEDLDAAAPPRWF